MLHRFHVPAIPFGRVRRLIARMAVGLAALVVAFGLSASQIPEGMHDGEELAAALFRILAALETEPAPTQVGPLACVAPEGFPGTLAELYDKVALLAEALSELPQRAGPQAPDARRQYRELADKARSQAIVARASCASWLAVSLKTYRVPSPKHPSARSTSHQSTERNSVSGYMADTRCFAAFGGMNGRCPLVIGYITILGSTVTGQIESNTSIHDSTATTSGGHAVIGGVTIVP